MNISKQGLDLIKSFEGLRLKAYKPVPTEKYFTIGYGHYAKDVTENMEITKEEAEKILLKDIAKFERNVNFYEDQYHWTQNQFDAMVSFAFNIGSINQLTQWGKRTIPEIAEKITAYNKAGGKVLAGLVRRREAEKNLFLLGSAVKTTEDIAKEVIQGLWGNGMERRRKLKAAGYDPVIIQRLVNRMM